MDEQPGTASPLPPRHKGQWQRTYEAKLERLIDLEEQADVAFEAWVALRFPGVSVDDLLG